MTEETLLGFRRRVKLERTTGLPSTFYDYQWLLYFELREQRGFGKASEFPWGGPDSPIEGCECDMSA